ncbi:MAG: extracellular solute-binding protein [Lachnospiraceae bacterium]|nr:extracellular solute-binding protein [Lachnospiraceae bacterium]
MKKRLMAILLIALAAAGIFAIGKSGMPVKEKEQSEDSSLFSNHNKDSIYLWYTDDALTTYLSSAAVAYNETHDARIVPVLESGLDYVETINRNSVESNVPDLYVISNDALEKAYLAGLAVPVEPTVNMEETFIGKGLAAATYKDKLLGYPFYFETSSLLYNKTYLRDLAVAQLSQEQEEAAAQEQQENADSGSADGTQEVSETGSGDAAQSSSKTGNADTAQSSSDTGSSDTATDSSDSQTTEAVEEESSFTEEQIEAKIEEYLPKTIEDIQTFGDMYDAPEQVESVFKWDVTDIFYNYFFIGNAINMGGESGWDTEQVDIYNLNAIQSMTAYQNLNNFFSIDTSAISYESTLNDFMEGKVVFTVATSDAVATLEQAKQDGTFAYEYGFVTTPSFKAEEPSSSLSVTNCVAINGYSTNQEVANDFARYLTCEYNDILYDRSGKVSAQKDMEYPYEALQVFAKEYETSVPIPKMLETSNYWLKLEALFAEIWNGADANEELKKLSEQIKYQITGEQIEETYIEDTTEDSEEDEVEYLDEDYYRQQAIDNQSE